MIPPTYKPKKKFMQLAIAEAKRARDRGDNATGAVVTQLIGNREVAIASAGNRVKTSGSSISRTMEGCPSTTRNRAGGLRSRNPVAALDEGWRFVCAS